MRVTIVGAGIAGLSTAWSLTKLGHDITLIEQGSIPNPLAASGGRHRIICRTSGHADDDAHSVAEAFDSWDLLWNDLGVSHYANCGVLGMSQSSDDGAEQWRVGLDRMGFDYERLDARDAAARYPFLDPDTFRHAYLDHEGGALFSERIARDIKAWLRMRGADLRMNTTALAVDPRAATVQLDDDTIVRGDRLVVTAGAWTPRLFPALAGQLTTYRNAVAYMEPPADLDDAWSNAPAIVEIGGASGGYVLPPIDGIGLAFGAGLHEMRTPDPDAARVTAPGEGDSLRRLFSPPLSRIGEYRVMEVKTSASTLTADGRLFSQRIGNALVVSAGSSHGYQFGAATGRRIAQAIDTGDHATLTHWLKAETTA